MIHNHHRRKGDRSDNRPVNILRLEDVLHSWAELHPEKARELGWSVSRYEEPENVSITITTDVLKEVMKDLRAARRAERGPIAPKERKVTAVRTPKDEENVIPELIEANREKHAESMGWDPDVPDYFVIVLALVKLLELEAGDVQTESE